MINEADELTLIRGRYLTAKIRNKELKESFENSLVVTNDFRISVHHCLYADEPLYNFLEVAEKLESTILTAKQKYIELLENYQELKRIEPLAKLT